MNTLNYFLLFIVVTEVSCLYQTNETISVDIFRKHNKRSKAGALLKIAKWFEKFVSPYLGKILSVPEAVFKSSKAVIKSVIKKPLKINAKSSNAKAAMQKLGFKIGTKSKLRVKTKFGAKSKVIARKKLENKIGTKSVNWYKMRRLVKKQKIGTKSRSSAAKKFETIYISRKTGKIIKNSKKSSEKKSLSNFHKKMKKKHPILYKFTKYVSVTVIVGGLAAKALNAVIERASSFIEGAFEKDTMGK
jgi:hypothetical protein